MKGFSLAKIDQNTLSTNGKQLYNNIEQLILKRKTQGGLDFTDEFALSDSIKKLEEERNRPVIENSDENTLLPDLASNDNIVMNTETSRETQAIVQIFSKTIEELKKLPPEERDSKEEWSENPMYKAYVARMKATKQKIETITVRIPDLKNRKR